MQTTIYLDVLFLLNLFVTYLLLMATARLLYAAYRKWRVLCGALLGGAYSLLILFDLHPAELCINKLLMGASLVFAVFWKRRQWLYFGKIALCFVVVNFLFAGFMTALWLFAAPSGMQFSNGVVYFDISALTLAVSTAAAYLVITLFTAVWNRRTRKSELIDVTLSWEGRQALIRCFTDTGNQLCDIFTGLPVIVCEYASVAPLLPEKLRPFFCSPASFPFEKLEGSAYPKKLKVIPIRAASGEGSLPAFQPDDVQIGEKHVRAVIAVTGRSLSDGSFQGILNHALL